MDNKIVFKTKVIFEVNNFIEKCEDIVSDHFTIDSDEWYIKLKTCH